MNNMNKIEIIGGIYIRYINVQKNFEIPNDFKIRIINSLVYQLEEEKEECDVFCEYIINKIVHDMIDYRKVLLRGGM